MKLVINKGGSSGSNTTDANNDNGTETVYMELTLPQFYDFLAEMEKARATIDFFSG